METSVSRVLAYQVAQEIPDNQLESVCGGGGAQAGGYFTCERSSSGSNGPWAYDVHWDA